MYGYDYEGMAGISVWAATALLSPVPRYVVGSAFAGFALGAWTIGHRLAARPEGDEDGMDTGRSTAQEQKALKHAPLLRQQLQELVAMSAKAFTPPPSFDSENHMAFMAITFAVKQNEHARSVLLLDQSADAVLIGRSMWEGLCQLLWAAQAPDDRPLRWRSFAFVLDWRLMQKELAAGKEVAEDRREKIAEGLREHGRYFLNGKALEAQARSLPLPDDPYTKNWYGEREKEIFHAVGGDTIYEEVYGLFSEWHHWRMGALGHLIRYDTETTTFTMSTRNPTFTALALAGAFSCLWQTMSFLENTLLSRIRADLDGLYKSFLAIKEK